MTKKRHMNYKKNTLLFMFISVIIMIMGGVIAWISPEGFYYSLYHVNIYGLLAWIFIVNGAFMLVGGIVYLVFGGKH